MPTADAEAAKARERCLSVPLEKNILVCSYFSVDDSY